MILGCTKKNPLCHHTRPSETVSALSSPFGAVILQWHTACACYTAPTAFIHPFALGCLSSQHTSSSVSAAPEVVQGEHLQNPTLLGPIKSYPACELPTEAKKEPRKKIDTDLTALIPLLLFLTPSKTDQLFVPSPGPAGNSVPLSLLLLWPRGRTCVVSSKLPPSHCKGWRSAQSYRPDFKFRQAIISWVFSLTARVPAYFPCKHRKNKGSEDLNLYILGVIRSKDFSQNPTQSLEWSTQERGRIPARAGNPTTSTSCALLSARAVLRSTSSFPCQTCAWNFLSNSSK